MEPIIAYIGDTLQLGETISADDIKSMRTDVISNVPANDQELYVKCVQIAVLLQGLGFPPPVIVYCIAQVMHETNYFRSDLYRNWNNLSGIKWTPHDQYANGKQKNGYATYPNQPAWARRYKEVLSQSPGRPINATTAAQFGDGLKANHYFEDPHYAIGFNRALQKYSQLYRDYSQKVLVEHADPKAPWSPKDWWHNLKWYEKVGLGVATFTGVVILTRR